VLALLILPRSLRAVIRALAHAMSEPEVKFVFLFLFGLGALATAAGSEAVLPAYLLGLVAAGTFLVHDDDDVDWAYLRLHLGTLRADPWLRRPGAVGADAEPEVATAVRSTGWSVSKAV
jgi:hypothetical protein